MIYVEIITAKAVTNFTGTNGMELACFVIHDTSKVYCRTDCARTALNAAIVEAIDIDDDVLFCPSTAEGHEGVMSICTKDDKAAKVPFEEWSSRGVNETLRSFGIALQSGKRTICPETTVVKGVL